jgi:ribonuclease E
MKGATHNLVVRTRTDVALYVLNHKRGHLRDLESSFKVTLAVIADPTVSAQQSFIIDRGEQVHTLEAAKALLAAQVAAFPPQVEEAFDEEEPFDIETESAVETEETEGLTDDTAGGEESGSEADGHKRKRRRRRRGRAGEAREGGQPPNEDNGAAQVASEAAEIPGVAAEEGESDEEESDEQPGTAHGDHAPGGERRPRRRGRRGGRRRRGGPEDGLAGSIADELAPASPPEASGAVADFDGLAPPAPPVPEVRPEPTASAEQHDAEPAQAEAARYTESETTQEAERAARRRSTVREKVSFLAAEPAPAANRSQAENSQPEPTAAPAPAETIADTQPRRAGWWSRRFGGGE